MRRLLNTLSFHPYILLAMIFLVPGPFDGCVFK
jgi:hypothetical protein